MMKTLLTRAIAFFVVLLLVALGAIFGSTVIAADYYTHGDNLTYDFDQATGTVTVSGNGPMTDFYTEGSLKPSFSYDDDVKKVVIESGVTSIGAAAFYCCKNLKELIIPDTVTSIDLSAFDHCKLESVIIDPKNEAFSLDENNVLYNKDKTMLIACLTPSSLTSYDVPSGVTKICNHAFYQCLNLQSITIPDSVTEIERLAFSNCSSLNSVKLSKNLELVGCDVFRGTPWYETWLNSQSNGVVYLNDKIAYDYKGKVPSNGKVTVKQGTLSIAEYAFYHSDITSITIPNTVKTIGEYAFAYCEKLAEVVIPDSVTTIGEFAFAFCENLTKAKLSDSLATMGKFAFAYCEKLSEITIPDSLSVLEQDVFTCCKALTEITIPDSVTKIGPSAFGGCVNLKTINIHDNITSISALSFYNTAWYNAQPDGMIYLGNIALCNKGKFAAEHLEFKKGTTVIADNALSFFKGDPDNIKEVTVPEGVTVIGDSSFADCRNIKKVNLPNSLKSVYDRAFANCSGIKILNIPENVTKVGAEAFIGCPFTKIYIPESVEHIALKAFGYVEEYIGEEEYKSVKIPDFTVYSAKGSAAEKYAKENGFRFVEHTKHTIVTAEAEAPTYISVGFTEGKKCAVCGIATVTQDIIPKKLLGATSKISTTKTSSTVTLKWNKVKGADGYRVFQRVNGKWKTLTNTTKLTYTVKNLKSDTKYTFAVRAYVLDGQKKVFAPKYKTLAVTTSKVNLGTTSKITATKTSSSVTIKWKKVKGADGYRVFQRVNGKWKTLTNTTKLTYTIKKLKAGTKYTFAVRAYVVEGEKKIFASSYTKINAVTKCVTPSLKVTSTKKGTVKLSWTNVAGETGYQVWYSTKSNENFKKISNYKANVVSATKSGLTSGKTYYFKVRSYKKTADGYVYSDWQQKSIKVK